MNYSIARYVVIVVVVVVVIVVVVVVVVVIVIIVVVVDVARGRPRDVPAAHPNMDELKNQCHDHLPQRKGAAAACTATFVAVFGRRCIVCKEAGEWNHG